MSMKAAELREMSNAELTKKLAELKEELFNLRFQMATSSWTTLPASSRSRRTSRAS